MSIASNTWIAGQNILEVKLAIRELLVHGNFVYLYDGVNNAEAWLDNIYRLNLSDDTVTDTGVIFPVAGSVKLVPIVFNDF